MRKKELRRRALLLAMVILAFSLAACKKNTGNENTPTEKPTPAVGQDETGQETNGKDNDGDKRYALSDYFPMLADVEYIYAGEGNEYAAYSRFTDYLSEDGSRIQTRSNNGGTETVRVIENRDGKITVIKTVNECYYRDNFLNAAENENGGQAEILLMEPLVEGTQWSLADGRKRYISGLDIEVETPLGKYSAIEVTTENDGSISKDYYAAGVGLVKTLFVSEGYEVKSELSEIKKDAVYTKSIDIFYPGIDEKIYVKPVTISFKTGDITRLLLQKELTKEAQVADCIPLTSSKTQINSMYLGADGIAYIDFSYELITEMNAGSGFEALILQCIANTVGNYYGTDKVYITVDGKPYESGHISMSEGETIEVDMSRVQE